MAMWTDETIIQFINEVRVRPELWDVENITYKDREAKRKSWADIAAQFGVAADEAYAKFRNLRTYARNEYKKSKGRIIWFAFDAMSFLFSPNVQSQSAENESAGRLSTNDFPPNQDESSDSTDPLEMSPVTVSLKKAKRNEEQETQTATEMSRIQNENPGRNFYSGFGEYVANKLNTYDKYTRSQVEFRISKILFDADMGLFDKASHRQVPSTDGLNSQTPTITHCKTERV